MFHKWVINTRKKPKHVRDNIAFVIAGSFTAILFLVWVVITPGKLIENAEEKDTKNPAFSTLWSQIKEQAAAVSGSLPDKEVKTAEPVAEPSTPTPVSLSATSSNWALSSTTVREKSIRREVPIVIVPQASSSQSTSVSPSNP